MSEVTVTIFDRDYRLAVSSGEEELLKDCARQVDEKKPRTGMREPRLLPLPTPLSRLRQRSPLRRRKTLRRLRKFARFAGSARMRFTATSR